ncbi:hypothetical protein L1077_15665 [Pseudoalteromonas luteoviolacea]|uniref:hypothetical protein n=1 Tax=Pseudoalteromonas luteoviolacea TaxID=43657 RepID=UPI001F22423F|nr:hypothetical protein [Pseudoalteromonas luteoviolacea]MCF6440875.1 hypothetical protein [Pseudoalteromonas luteoviolacea]
MHPFSLNQAQSEVVTGGNSLVSGHFKGFGERITMAIPENGFDPIFDIVIVNPIK